MENILPFLLGVAVLAFKIYDNFNKEQEKARKRNPSAPAAGTSVETENPSRPFLPVEPEPRKTVEEIRPASPYQTAYKERAQTQELQPRFEKYEKPERINSAISREAIEKTPFQTPAVKKKSLYVEHVDTEDGSPDVDFSLRDAVIKEAILNRPQF